MSISTKAKKENLHWRAVKGGMKAYMEGKAALDRNPMTNDENICKHCNFKARYQFIRCPECGKMQD